MPDPEPKHLRVIPRLDIKGPTLVKGVRMEGLRVLGRPEDFARAYATDGADELLYLDVVASLYGRNNLTEIVRRTAAEIFIPLTVGGGVRSLDDIQTLLRAGADKVAMNTAAIARPELVAQAARAFGSQCVVVSIEAKEQPDGSFECYTDNGRERTGVEAVGWAKQVCELGAGELLVGSVDRDGTGSGFALDLIRRLAAELPIPVIAASGAGSKEHVQAAVCRGRADAVAVGSLLHYHYAPRLTARVEDLGLTEGNVAFLKGLIAGSQRPPIPEPIDLPGLKAALAAAGISCRG
ncbi:MAG: imidazole glycerol phosphate synthase cyclase subunit [Thermodesulfobacteriota bacterium]